MSWFAIPNNLLQHIGVPPMSHLRLTPITLRSAQLKHQACGSSSYPSRDSLLFYKASTAYGVSSENRRWSRFSFTVEPLPRRAAVQPRHQDHTGCLPGARSMSTRKIRWRWKSLPRRLNAFSLNAISNVTASAKAWIGNNRWQRLFPWNRGQWVAPLPLFTSLYDNRYRVSIKRDP
jgi:hypothetical protein